MDDVTFGEWAAMSALNGIVGALLGGAIGGFIAWLLLNRTLQHEREGRVRTERAARIERVLQALVDLYAAVQDFEIDAFTEAEPARSMEQAVRAKLLFVEVISGPVDPRLTRQVLDLRKRMAELPRRGVFRVPLDGPAQEFKRDAELAVLTEIAVFSQFDPDNLGDPDRFG